MKILLRLASILITSTVFFFVASSVQAATLQLSPASATVTKGGTTTLQVRVDTQGDQVTGVSAYISYPQDKIDVVSVGSSGSGFAIDIEKTWSNGLIKISRASMEPKKGVLRVATVTIKGKSDGQATLAFIGGAPGLGSAIAKADTNPALNLGASKGAVITISGTATPKPKATAKPSSKPGIVPAPTPYVSETDDRPPFISNISVTNVNKFGATINWNTDEPSESFVEYGTERDVYNFNVSRQDFMTSHSLVLQGPLISPGTKLYFRVVGVDQAGNISVSDPQQLQILGYAALLKIFDKNNNPLTNTNVMIFSDPMQGKTNENGEVRFENLSPGRHRVEVNASEKDQAVSEIEIKDGIDVQSFDVKVNLTKPSSLPKIDFRWIWIIFGAVVGLFLGKMIWKYIKEKKDTPPPVNPFEAPGASQ